MDGQRDLNESLRCMLEARFNTNRLLEIAEVVDIDVPGRPTSKYDLAGAMVRNANTRQIRRLIAEALGCGSTRPNYPIPGEMLADVAALKSIVSSTDSVLVPNAPDNAALPRESSEVQAGRVPEPRWSERIGDYRSKVDVVLITVRHDEFKAVLRRFPCEHTVSGARDYNLSRVLSDNKKREFLVATVRLVEQGNIEAANATRDAIEDLDPGCLLVVGIAGGVPGADVTLGDVFVGTQIHDLTLGAIKEGHLTFSMKGGPVDKRLGVLIANLQTSIRGWPDEIGIDAPLLDGAKELYGDDEAKKHVADNLRKHFGENKSPRVPVWHDGSVASSGMLIKDTDLIQDWKELIRQVQAVEMETAGAYQAAQKREKSYPITTIRAISDIVGLVRDDRWTSYACESAASFALAFVKSWTKSFLVSAKTDDSSVSRGDEVKRRALNLLQAANLAAKSGHSTSGIVQVKCVLKDEFDVEAAYSLRGPGIIDVNVDEARSIVLITVNATSLPTALLLGRR